MWRCSCGAMVSDKTTSCPMCSSVGAKSPDTKNRADGGGIGGTAAPGDEGRDVEGYTAEERMRRRPMKEIANAHLLSVAKARHRDNMRKKKGKHPFSDAVVPGSVRTSRPIFSTIKYGR
jgi:hypothetical protein